MDRLPMTAIMLADDALKVRLILRVEVAVTVDVLAIEAAREISRLACADMVDADWTDADLAIKTAPLADIVDALAMVADLLRTTPIEPDSANGPDARGENPSISGPVYAKQRVKDFRRYVIKP
jgi:hypothetical protein